MSVSFFASMAPIIGFDLECVCGATYLAEGDEAMSEEVATATLLTVKASNAGFDACEDDDCFTYGIYLKALDGSPDSPSVNMANGNVRPVLAALGLAPDGADFGDICCGSVSAEGLLGRILLALGVAPISAERPDVARVHASQAHAHEGRVVDVIEKGPTWVECGVEESYVQTRLTQLLEVATFAQAHGREVCWS